MSISNKLSAFFVTMFNKDKSSFNFLCEGNVPNHVLKKTYQNFINEKILIPIEDLLIEEKTKLWEECKLTGVNKNKIVDASKILYTIKFINENFEKNI